MRKIFPTAVVLIAFIFGSCSDLQSQESSTVLPATEFAAKIKEVPDAVIVDVRTSEEYFTGHLPNAKNFDWQGAQFDKQINSLDKSKPVFVYCHSGKRSKAAASSMRKQGFKRVYELDGGIIEWKVANFPENEDNAVVPVH